MNHNDKNVLNQVDACEASKIAGTRMAWNRPQLKVIPASDAENGGAGAADALTNS